MRTLPDYLRKGMKMILVGANPGDRSARVGHYYAGRNNQFWPIMYESRRDSGADRLRRRPAHARIRHRHDRPGEAAHARRSKSSSGENSPKAACCWRRSWKSCGRGSSRSTARWSMKNSPAALQARPAEGTALRRACVRAALHQRPECRSRLGREETILQETRCAAEESKRLAPSQGVHAEYSDERNPTSHESAGARRTLGLRINPATESAGKTQRAESRPLPRRWYTASARGRRQIRASRGADRAPGADFAPAAISISCARREPSQAVNEFKADA